MQKTKKEKFSPYRSEFHFASVFLNSLIGLSKHPFRYPILFSILLHISLLGLFNGLDLIHFGSNANERKTLNVTAISPEMMKRLRTIGVKNGREKDSFSLPAPKYKGQQLDKKEEEDLSLKSLGVGIKDVKTTDRVKPTREYQKNYTNPDTLAEGPGAKSFKESMAEARASEKRIIYAQTVKSLGLSSDEREVLNAAGLDMNFSPPKGVSEEELNSEEKVYYAFQKRAYTNYVNSFISQYRRILNIKPGIKNALMNGKHEMTGKIIFDKDGNIVSSKILRWSQDNDVQTLFDKTLENMSALPNPPETIVRDGQFIIYYQLYINS